MSGMKCRFCGEAVKVSFANLRSTPMANSYISDDKIDGMEAFYPLNAMVCENCFLVQLEKFESPKEIFGEYAYFSSYSKSWLNHARNYVDHMIRDHGITRDRRIVEIASNDGYLLQYFKEYGYEVLGVEPAQNVAEVAVRERGIPTVTRFFGTQLAAELRQQGKAADLLIGNNVLAHVPDINDFVAGIELVLSEDGIATFEFPHLLNLIEQAQFDTIYHEHFSYLSVYTVKKIFASHGLELFDVAELPTHGGSVRIYARRKDRAYPAVRESVGLMDEKERAFGIDRLETYMNFDEKVKRIKRSILKTLISLKEQNKTIVGFGAPAKGNTFLNYCGIGTDFIDFTVDDIPFKQGKYLPGTRIPIRKADAIMEARPDYIFILPWNFKKEIMDKLSYIREWNGRFLTAIPDVEII